MLLKHTRLFPMPTTNYQPQVCISARVHVIGCLYSLGAYFRMGAYIREALLRSGNGCLYS